MIIQQGMIIMTEENSFDWGSQEDTSEEVTLGIPYLNRVGDSRQWVHHKS